MRSILMLEHDDDDRYITQTVFDEQRYEIKLDFVSTSDELFSHLNTAVDKRQKLPSLILLNYHAKPVNAPGILKDLKADSRFAHIPVVVLSGSVKEDVVKECYVSGACSFVQKPSRASDTDSKIENFFKYWFKTVELL